MNLGVKFREIENKVLQSWDHSDPAHLTTAAVTGFEYCNVSEIDPAECLSWVLAETELPSQTHDFDFGHPSITVINNTHFAIDIMYWLENSSPTHNHVTCGAFAALHGDRLHTEYEYEEVKEFDNYVSIGHLQRTAQELMKAGSVRAVSPHMIHDIFWIQKPSVTLVLRCKNHPGEHKTPREFWLPGLSHVNKDLLPESLLSRQIQSLSLLRRASNRGYHHALTSILQSGPPLLCYYTFLDAAISSPKSLDEALVAVDNSALIDSLNSSRNEFVRRSTLGGVLVRSTKSQATIALQWAGAITPGIEHVISRYGDPLDTFDDLRSETSAAIEKLSTVASRMILE